MTMILNYVVQCSWCWLVGKKNPFYYCGKGRTTASWKVAVKFYHILSLHHTCILFLFYCGGGIWWIFFLSNTVFVFCFFARPALLVLLQKKKKLREKVLKKREAFLTLTSKKAGRERWGFLNVQKAIVLLKLLTESFLTVGQKQPCGWHILYQRRRRRS